MQNNEISDQDELIRLRSEIKQKNEEIAFLKTRSPNIQSSPMREKDAKDIAYKFASERVALEKDLEESRSKYKSVKIY